MQGNWHQRNSINLKKRLKQYSVLNNIVNKGIIKKDKTY